MFSHSVIEMSQTYNNENFKSFDIQVRCLVDIITPLISIAKINYNLGKHIGPQTSLSIVIFETARILS